MQAYAHEFKRLLHLIRGSNRILLISHQKPDGDTLGSTLGLANWMIREGKRPTIFCVDTPSPTYRFLPNIHLYTNDETVFDDAYDLVIVLDSSNLKYAGVDVHLPRLKPGYVLVNIDHHGSNARYGDIKLVIPGTSSTSEIIYQFFKENDILLDSAMSTSLLIGLCTDTWNFCNPLTSVSALEAGSVLIAHGARFNDILRYFWKNQSFDAFALWGKLLSRLHHEPQFSVASTYLTAIELEDVPTELMEQMVNFLASIVGEVDTVLFLKEHSDGLVSGSFRGHKRNVDKLAAYLGGGGHPGAAAFRIRGKLEILENGRAKIIALDN
ncbi:MAG: DHH family phosphoesterase [Candidatus Uhrbacteria bacterium]|nr:DHH family phosphoesterase [Candidatus Uhrbacteria bacterium]